LRPAAFSEACFSDPFGGEFGSMKNPHPTASVEKPSGVVRSVRIVHVAFLVNVLLFVAIGEFVYGRALLEGNAWKIAFFAVSLTCAGLALFMRQARVQPAEERLASAPHDGALLNAWRGGNIAVFAACEAVALCGLLARVLGAEFYEAAPLYAIGLALLLVWTPRAFFLRE
jgi:hypothetical protein